MSRGIHTKSKKHTGDHTPRKPTEQEMEIAQQRTLEYLIRKQDVEDLYFTTDELKFAKPSDETNSFGFNSHIVGLALEKSLMEELLSRKMSYAANCYGQFHAHGRSCVIATEAGRKWLLERPPLAKTSVKPDEPHL
jgi:hypothetical protein